MPPFLKQIVRAHRDRAAKDLRDPADLERQAVQMPPSRGFRRALRDDAGLSVVAEIKRRSPSKGDLAPDLDPAKLSRQYASGGAACLSVLTDRNYFGGSPDDLRAARDAGLPVLRKDFTVSANDVFDARLMGADAVLLIVAALEPSELQSLFEVAQRVGLDALVEVHDEDELDRALQLGAPLIGINQRDLATFTVDGDRAAGLAAGLPADVVAVAESGVHGPDDARRLADAGYDAVLVGEWLVRSPDPVAAVGGLRGHPVGLRAGAAS